MRIGLYGGTFDPIHCGHLLLAESARLAFDFERVILLPLGAPPHSKSVRASAEDRFEMTRLATEKYPEFTVSRYEIDSPRISYTAETLRFFRERFPDDEIFYIVSSETFNDIPNWYRPDEVCRLASLVVADRAGYPPPNFDAFLEFTPKERVDIFRRQVFNSPLFEVSSTMIRDRIARGLSVRFLTPDVVVDYISEKRLYAPETEGVRD